MDLSGGYWLYRNTEALGLTGLATVAEMHYTTALNDPDAVHRGRFVSFQNRRSQLDAVNMTIGLHADLANHTACRVGAVFPLRSGLDRTFDAEVQVQLERRF